MKKVEEIVAEYRQKDLTGKIVDMSPVTEKDLADIIRMRNDPKMMYYLNQPMEITLDSQKAWFEKYRERMDDLYWTIKDKDGLVVGTNRLYDITADKCVQGSLMVDTRYSRTAPYAAEAIMLSLDFAFDVLGVQTIVNEDRHDNKNMNSLSRRFGFKFLRETDIRGVTYNYYELQKETYMRDAVMEVLDLWASR